MQVQFPFGPSIDSQSKCPFAPVHPEEAAVKGIDVPLIIGHTSREGIFLVEQISNYLNQPGSEIGKVVPSSLKDTLKKHYNLAFEDVIRIYFNGEPITKKSLEKLADFFGHLHFVEGIQRVVQTQIVKHCAPTYVYQFTYDKKPGFFKSACEIEMSGVCHSDDLGFLFRRLFSDGKVELPKKDSMKSKISEQMIEMWVNFASTGKPIPKLSKLLPVDWQPVDAKSGLRYLNICENLRMEAVSDIGQQYVARKYPKHVA